ncbi:MAG TPA: SIS domain-containing protein [Steroidobacteraceae bacterium]|jgi:glucosamine--fructose-6-phosphate aminotransferase (isomerizing)|nr:SIS domain-containing protein [Steroidobacteraceae bacterium]
MNGAGSQSAERTLMFEEAADASNAVRSQLQRHGASMRAIGAAIRNLSPRAVITCARGSSDHAATYAKYLIETHARVLTASSAPSVSSIYGIAQDIRGCLFIAISQSGRSPDLLASVASARTSGATILALCNSPDSPLMAAADLTIELDAGPEHSVAATKSYLASLAALARLVAAWTQNSALESALERLPDLMDRSWSIDWSAALPELESAANLYVVGRGLGLGAAQEIALKCKETCGIHAEGFSSAELRHGPYTLLRKGFPALLLAQADATRPGVEALALELARRDLPVLLAGGNAAGTILLPTPAAIAELSPILLVQSAYRMIATLSLRRGFDPDRPAHLNKITETV